MAQSIATVEQLVAARESRGLTVDDVARQLKLAPRQVQAIEQGDWAALPGLAFVRGVLRGYGRLLGADVEPLIATAASTIHVADLRPSASLDQPLPTRSMLGFGSGGSGNRLVWIGLAVLGVVALALFFGEAGDLSRIRSWLSRPAADAASPSESRDGGATTTETVPVPTVPSPVAPTPGPAPGPASAPSSSDAAASPGIPPVGPAATGAAPTGGGATSAPVAPPADAAAGGRVLRMRFAKDAWVEVRNAQGALLLSGLQKAESTRDIPVTGPVALVVGNAETVRVELDGKVVDLAPHTKATVAKLSLP